MKYCEGNQGTYLLLTCIIKLFDQFAKSRSFESCFFFRRASWSTYGKETIKDRNFPCVKIGVDNWRTCVSSDMSHTNIDCITQVTIDTKVTIRQEQSHVWIFGEPLVHIVPQGDNQAKELWQKPNSLWMNPPTEFCIKLMIGNKFVHWLVVLNSRNLPIYIEVINN